MLASLASVEPAAAASASAPASAASRKRRAPASGAVHDGDAAAASAEPVPKKKTRHQDPGRQAKTWCFTLNNPKGPLLMPEVVGYCVYQPEVGESGTPHFQGYVEFTKNMRVSAIKKLGEGWSTMHLEERRGTPEEAIAYCQKEDTRAGPVVMHGIPTRAGVGRAYSAMVEAMKEGMPVAQIMQEHTEEYLKHHRAVDAWVYASHVPTLGQLEADPAEPLLTVEKLRPWQKILFDELVGPAQSRRVTWVYDKLGGAGKSAFVRMLGARMNTLAMKTTSMDRGGHVFLSHRPTPQVVLFDVVREMGDEGNLSVGLMEAIKDGTVSTMFLRPRTERFVVPHVVVFANCLPPLAKATPNRWRVLSLVEAPCGEHRLFDITGDVATDAGWIWDIVKKEWAWPVSDIAYCPTAAQLACARSDVININPPQAMHAAVYNAFPAMPAVPANLYAAFGSN